MEKTKTKKIMKKGKKLSKPTSTQHKTAKKYHKGVTDFFQITTKEERMKECIKNGEMNSNKVREMIRKRREKNIIILNPNKKPKDLTKKHIEPKIKSKESSVRIERTNDKRNYAYKDFERIMRRIIYDAQKTLTEEEQEKYTEFIITLPTMMKPEDRFVDALNRIIKYLKGKEILSYYIPEDPTKEKEPTLSRELQRKYSLPKSEVQRLQNKQQSEARAKNLLTMAPITRAKVEKKRETALKRAEL